jgi:penicillin amidase
MVAYAAGVNAWIDQLDTRDLPLEYRLLGVRPAHWEPKYTIYLFGRMGQTLASLDPAVDRLRIQALVGPAAAEALVPVNSPVQEPIQPNGQAEPRFDFVRLPPPGAPDTVAARLLALRAGVTAEPGPLEVGALGSNNWAVSPSRTRDGHALLAGDPHLQLTLPSIWYEVHVNVPGQVDVAGVSLPGAPGVVIGFNRDVAWTFTNTGGDVTDFYAEVVDDPSAPTRYRLDGEWRPLRLRIETYRGPGGEVLAADTIRFDHRGPLRRVDGGWFSTRWTVLEPGAENDVFLHLARSKTVHEWLGQMEAYNAPTQNGLVADRAGTVAIRSSGWYPVRPGDGRGDRIFDGSSSASDWTGRLAVSQYPFGINPAQGYLASANQQPVDPRMNPAYLGADWPSPFRAIRINTLLRADSQMTPDAMRRMQTDPGSSRADLFVPQFLASAEATLADGPGDERLRQAAGLLGEWDRQYQPDNQRAVLFELAMREASRRLFDELIPPGDTGAAARPLPVSSQIVLGLMRDPESTWWDDRRTPEREGRDRILAASLRAAYDSAVANFGLPGDGGWEWGKVWPTDIWHLLRMASLSALNLPVRGGPETIAPAGRHGSHGPSWRMVVELGDEVVAMGTYPGGQSGNPASELYRNRVAGWTRGELDTLLFPRTPSALPADRVRSRLAFIPGER